MSLQQYLNSTSARLPYRRDSEICSESKNIESAVRRFASPMRHQQELKLWAPDLRSPHPLQHPSGARESTGHLCGKWIGPSSVGHRKTYKPWIYKSWIGPERGTATGRVMPEAVTATTAGPSRHSYAYFRKTYTGALTETSQHLSLTESFPAIQHQSGCRRSTACMFYRANIDIS
jgi:hypothetical protein